MDVDFSVELGAEDPTLEFPWEAPGTALRYYDLKNQPEQLRFVDEAEQYRELHDFLAAVNAPASLLETAKCDAWVEEEISEAEEIYEAEAKFMSYVDLLFAGERGRKMDFATYERVLRRLVELLERVPPIASAAEFILRRCYFRDGEPATGFYVTFYLSGYGEDELAARRHWGIGLNVVQNALLQLSAEIRRKDHQP